MYFIYLLFWVGLFLGILYFLFWDQSPWNANRATRIMGCLAGAFLFAFIFDSMPWYEYILWALASLGILLKVRSLMAEQ